MRLTRLFPFALCVFLLNVPADPRSQDDVRARIRNEAGLVIVPITVKDSRGEFVYDIRREEFRVFEDDVEQEIALFTQEPFPLSAVALIDNALQARFAERVQQSLGAMAGGFGPSDEVAVALFETFFQPVTEFLRDNDKLHVQLSSIVLTGQLPGRTSGPLIGQPRVDTSPSGPPPTARVRAGALTKNLDDALFAAAQLFDEVGRDRRKVILVVSDGANSKNNTVAFSQVIRHLLYRNIIVYAAGVTPAILRRGSSVLENYAFRTGGEVFYGASRAELESLYGRITEQARNQYTLAYLPRDGDRAREFHSLEVRVRRPNLTVMTRDGFFVSAGP